MVFVPTVVEVKHKRTVLPSEKTDFMYHFSIGSDLLTQTADIVCFFPMLIFLKPTQRKRRSIIFKWISPPCAFKPF